LNFVIDQSDGCFQLFRHDDDLPSDPSGAPPIFPKAAVFGVIDESLSTADSGSKRFPYVKVSYFSQLIKNPVA